MLAGLIDGRTRRRPRCRTAPRASVLSSVVPLAEYEDEMIEPSSDLRKAGVIQFAQVAAADFSAEHAVER